MNKVIFPGSFDPITNGHINIIKKALQKYDEVVVLVANNPAKVQYLPILERFSVVKEVFKNNKNVRVEFTEGLTAEFAKKEGITNIIRGVRNKADNDYELWLEKEYQKTFKEIKLITIEADEELKNVSSSKIKEMLNEGKDISKLVPEIVVKMYKKR